MEAVEPAIGMLAAILAQGERAVTILVIVAAGAFVWLQHREKTQLETQLLALLQQALAEKERSIETLRTLTVRHEQALDLLRQATERRHVPS